MSVIACVECGKTEEPQYSRETSEAMITKSLCFGCLFWTEWLERDKADTASIVVEGRHYHVGDENPTPRDWRGFGGSRFRVRRLATGEEFETTNLWHQGEVPEHFRSRFPDTAEFLR